MEKSMADVGGGINCEERGGDSGREKVRDDC